MMHLCQCVLIEKSNFFIENAVPITAIIVSLLAFIVSIWSLMSQRKHNRKSVLPAGHVQLDDGVQGLQVRIVNKGCGPMFIKEFTAVCNGVIKHNLVYYLPDSILEGVTHRTHTEPEGYWLLPGDKLILIHIEGSDKDQRFIDIRENVRSILGNIEVHLTFSDVYDKIHPVFSKTLEWYKHQL